jgi:hypothetical protein
MEMAIFIGAARNQTKLSTPNSNFRRALFRGFLFVF